MARPITQREMPPAMDLKGDEPGITLVPVPLWEEPKGLDYRSRKSRIDHAHSPEMLNFVFYQGKYVSRKGSDVVGAVAAAPVMAVVNFVTGSGIGFLLRFLTTKLQLWDGTTWNDLLATSAAIVASGLLTGSANFANGETVTIAGKQYTFQTVLVNADGNVLLGATLAASLINLKLAINLESGSGTYYAALTTIHPSVQATTISLTTLKIEAKTAGVVGNAITTVETLANGSFGSGTLTGGADAVFAASFMTGGTSDYFAYTAFNDTLLFSNNIDGLWEYSPLMGSIQKITLGPNARHLSTIGGRVVASAARGQEYTTEWSAKNNSHGWGDTFEGAGSEDLRSTPGGQVDQVVGTWPISEDISLMVRSNSIWQVTQTGDPDAPFKFDRLYAKLGSRSRHSVDVIPGGLIMLSNDDVYMVDTTKPQPIGTLIKDRIFQTADLTKAKGLYRPKLRQYWLTLGGDEVFVYSLEDQGWTRLKYTFDIRWMEESIPNYSGQTWDASTGTWDAQTTVWDAALGTLQTPTFYLATAEALGNVIQENLTSGVDSYMQTGKTVQGLEIQTPQLLASTPLDKVQINELHMEYEASVSLPVLFEYSPDGGVSWNSYSSKMASYSTKTEILKPEKEINRDSLMLRLRSVALGALTLVSFTPMLLQGPRRKA